MRARVAGSGIGVGVVTRAMAAEADNKLLRIFLVPAADEREPTEAQAHKGQSPRFRDWRRHRPSHGGGGGHQKHGKGSRND